MKVPTPTKVHIKEKIKYLLSIGGTVIDNFIVDNAN